MRASTKTGLRTAQPNSRKRSDTSTTNTSPLSLSSKWSECSSLACNFVCFIVLFRDIRNIQKRNLNESFASTPTRASRDSFAFKQHSSSINGQWASENVNSGDFITNSRRSKKTKNSEIVEEDFSGNPQVRSKDSDPSRLEQQLQQEESMGRKPDINDL